MYKRMDLQLAAIAVYFPCTKLTEEYNLGVATSSPNKEFTYAGSSLLATIQGTTTTYHHPDHLSVRLDTDSSGNVVGQQGHYPFGESWYASGSTTKWQFTGYLRDNKSGNDYAYARSYVSRLGRFSSAESVVGGNGPEPQRLNRFSYVAGDPVNRTDPDGRLIVVGGCCFLLSVSADRDRLMLMLGSTV